jgi:integrase
MPAQLYLKLHEIEGEAVANITERNGKFHVRVYRKEGAVCKSFIMKKDALAWARQTEADIQAGRWKPANKNDGLTLREALERYSNEVTVSKKGATQEACVINAIVREQLAEKALVTIKAADAAFLRDKWLKDLAPATVRRRLAIVSHCFEIARKEWSIDVINPVLAIRKPTVANGRNRRLQDGELAAILEASESTDLAPVALIAVETAMRLSEILGLRWSDVSLTHRNVTIRETKNGTSRIVPLSPEAITVFQGLLRRIDGRVFGAAGPSISQAWRRAVERAKAVNQERCCAAEVAPKDGYLTDLHFHDLRHEATSRLFERGVFGTMEVATITGHKTLQMLSRYTHMNVLRLAEKLAASSSVLAQT